MKCRKLLSAVLALCMVLGSLTAFASETAQVTYDCSAITFCYGNEAASTLQGGKTLTANVSVSKTGGEQNLTFAMFLYKNNKPVDADISTKAVDREKVDFAVSIDTPADVSGCSVVVFLWDSLKSMNAICNSAIFPEGSTKLSYLSVDGVVLKGFSPDVYEYTYEIEAARVDAPVIGAKAFDGSAVVDIKAPTDFPGKTVVKVSHPGGTSSEYIINYKASGITQFVTDLTNCYDNKLPEEFGGGDVTHKAQYLPESLKVGEEGYLQRNYTIASVNDDRILGKDRIIQSYSLTHENNGGAPKDVETFQSTDVYPWINFTLLRGATVRVLLCVNTHSSKLTNIGYKEEVSTNANGFFNVIVGSANRAHKYMYSKHFNAGEKVVIPNVGEGNNSVYCVVLDYDPFGYVPGEDVDPEDPTPDTPVVPEEPKDESLNLKAVSVGGVAVDGFNAEKLEYTVNLNEDMAAALNAPAVSYELADSTSTAVVTNPTEFPGKATITVTNAENKTKTYVLNYSVENILGITTNVDGKTLTYAQNGLKSEGAVASDRDPSKTWYISEINYEAFKDNSLIFGGVNASEGVTEFTFNLPRASTVSVIYNTAAPWPAIEPSTKILNSMGFSYDNDEAYYKIVVSNRVNSTQRWYRMTYYKNMEAGEYTLPYCVPEMPQLVAIKYLPWGQSDFDTEEPEDPTPDTPVEPEQPEVNPLELKSLKIDGVEVADFNANTLEYTVALTDAQLAAKNAPTVTYELAYETSSATVTNPDTFPGSVLVTVTDGKDTRTYTITYTADEMIKDMYVLNKDNTIPKEYTGAASDMVLSGNNIPRYIRSGLVEFTELKPIYTDRNGHRLIHDKSLVGNDVILTPVNWSQDEIIKAAFGSQEALDWLNFTVKRDAVVKVFTDPRPVSSDNITDYGFTKYTDGVMDTSCCNTAKVYFCNKINGSLDRCQTIMYTKTFKAGDKVAIPNFTFNDYSYSVAIEYPGWGEEYTVIPEAKATLSDIKVNGTKVEGFNSEIFEYEVEFDAAALEMPEVTYTTKKNATATLQNPTTFPGKATITVTEEGETNEYTLTYVPSVELIADLAVCEEAEIDPASAVFPKVVSGIKVGDKNFTDRSYQIETINEEGIENADRIMTSIGWKWDEKKYGEVFNGTLIKDWLSFTLNRGAYVTIYDDTDKDAKLFEGFTMETAPAGAPYIAVRYNASRTADYIVKYTRYFPAGSVVNVPNAANAETYAVVVNYAPWDFEEPEQEEIPQYRISYSDLVPKVTKGENANVTVGNWYDYISESVMNRKLSKTFDMPEGSDTQTITLTLDKFTNQNIAIIVNPTEEGASKDVIVNSDGSEIEWSNHDQASLDYDYEGAGEDGYNADYVTYAQYAKNVTTLSSGDSYVYRTMVSSDDKYITGSMVVYSRNLLCGGVSWIDIPEEYAGCNYIVPLDGKINGGTYTLTFTVNAPVEVAIYTSVAGATVSDDVSEEAWATESASFKKRHMNVVDNLTIAYMIKKGYLPLADIGSYATANNTNGYRIRRFDLFSQLKEDCGVANGWAIDPAKKEATGFTGTINDYTYDQYLAAWVDEE